MLEKSRLTTHRHGVRLDLLEVLCLFGDEKAGTSYLIRGTRGPELEVRVTPSGRLRLGRLKERTAISLEGS